MKFILFYALGVYLIFVVSGLHINAHGEPHQGEGGFPYERGGYAGRIPEPAKSCREYLTTCEKSCSNRGDMFRFLCLGQQYNPDSERYRCQCGDEAFQSQVVKAQPKPVEPKQ